MNIFLFSNNLFKIFICIFLFINFKYSVDKDVLLKIVFLRLVFDWFFSLLKCFFFNFVMMIILINVLFFINFDKK